MIKHRQKLKLWREQYATHSLQFSVIFRPFSFAQFDQPTYFAGTILKTWLTLSFLCRWCIYTPEWSVSPSSWCIYSLGWSISQSRWCVYTLQWSVSPSNLCIYSLWWSISQSRWCIYTLQCSVSPSNLCIYSLWWSI